MSKAYSYDRLERYDEAIDTWTRAVKVKPDLQTEQAAFSNISRMYRETGRFDQSIKAYRQLIEIEIRWRKVDSNAAPSADLHAKELAELLAKVGRWEEAIASYKQALALATTASEESWAYADLASLYERLRRYHEAVAAYNEAVTRQPEWPEPHFALGLIYAKLGRKEAALNEQRVLTQLDPKMANVLRTRIVREH